MIRFEAKSEGEEHMHDWGCEQCVYVVLSTVRQKCWDSRELVKLNTDSKCGRCGEGWDMMREWAMMIGIRCLTLEFYIQLYYSFCKSELNCMQLHSDAWMKSFPKWNVPKLSNWITEMNVSLCHLKMVPRETKVNRYRKSSI